LCRKWDDTFAQLVALGALCIVHLTRAALTTARALGEQLVELAERTGLPETFRSMAYVPLGQALCYSGELPAARAQLERARAFCAAAVPLQDVGGGLWVDAEVTILVHLSGTLCLLGYPEQAVRSAEQAIARARALQNPYSLHFALVLGGTTYQLQRNWTMLERCTTEALQIANECGFSFFGEHAEVLQAISRVERGPNALGAAADIDAIQAGVDRLVARGTRLALGNYLVALAAALGRSGRVAAALQTIDKALAHVAESGEAVMEAEIYCVKGELLLMEVRGVQGWPEPEPARRTRALGTAHHDAAEAHFQRAIEVARQQGAKWWELRAATSLSRLWQQHGKEGEARALLGATVGWFGEGFATPDLQEARSLLAELGVTDSGQ